MTDMRTQYLGLNLKNPLVVSASPMSDRLETLERLETCGAAAVVMRSLFEEQIEQMDFHVHELLEQWTDSTFEAQSFFPPVQVHNSGPANYLRALTAAKRHLTIPVIGSLNGVSPGGWLRYARMIEDAGADALELNVYFVAATLDETSEEVEQRYISLVSDVRQAIDIPLAVKIAPFFSSLPQMVKRLFDAGADGLVLFNRFVQPDIDLESLTVQATVHLSTSDELTLPLRWIAILRGMSSRSFAASTGVHTASDVIKVLLAGADVAMMASALLRHGPDHVAMVLNDAHTWLDEHEYESVAQMKGSMSQASCPEPANFERAHYVQALNSFSSPF